ncbi:Aminodeoxychorismate lyase [Vibrio stylophorae]|uniref:Aminodeoxychorismate lyase n=1 Tax=Vibrio stylophorae TaxID=659351 RepID=A0ABN8DPB9_9VIBR|nr:aminodeoxychorismate lyase [Vibrio stylophorae]CAH0533034.1 Aminodeoxychorismate lyase [Vibrio stylophorae]
MQWINGQPASQVNARDRALHYGDGCFTTAQMCHGTILDWSSHLARLQDHCQRLWISFDEWSALESCCQRIAHERQQGVLKVLISRGSGGRGYSPQGCDAPMWLVQTSELPSHYEQWRQQGVRLGLSEVSLARQPLLAGIKHLNRLEQVLIKQALLATDWDDALVCDTVGHIIETSMANVFWRIGNILYTPKLDQAGVAGIMRAKVLGQCAFLGVECQQVCEPISALTMADELMICNALLGVAPVQQFEQRMYRDFSMTRQLQETLRSC